jgi:hypothetical protein
MPKTVTLAKANKIRNLLEDKIIPNISSEIRTLLGGTFKGFEDRETIENVFSTNIESISGYLKQFEDVSTVILKLRDLISKKNEEAHINQLMAKIESHRKTRQLLNDVILVNRGTEQNIDQIVSLIEFTNKSTSVNGSLNRGIAYFVNNEVFNSKVLKENIQSLDTELRELEEERNSRNYSNQVILDDEIIKVLETYKLV